MRLSCAVLALSVALCGGCSRPEEAPEPAFSPSPPTAAEDLNSPLPDPLPDEVARVNGQPIHLAEIVPLTRDELRRFIPAEREEKTPAVLRRALRRYIDQELLLQEALARGIEADTHKVEWDYDQARREYPDDAEWAGFLDSLGFDEQSFKAALRVRHTVAALVAREADVGSVSDEDARALYDADPKVFARPGDPPPPFEAVRDEVRERVRLEKEQAVAAELVAALRAKAKIETFI